MNIALAFPLYAWLGIPGLALAFSLAYFVGAVLTLCVLHVRLGGIDGARMASPLAKRRRRRRRGGRRELGRRRAHRVVELRPRRPSRSSSAPRVGGAVYLGAAGRCCASTSCRRCAALVPARLRAPEACNDQRVNDQPSSSESGAHA